MRRLLDFSTIAFNLLAELIAPTACVACDLPLSSRLTLYCSGCVASIEQVDRELSARHTLAVFRYGGAVATTIHRFKYQDRPDLGARLAHVMSAVILQRDRATLAEAANTVVVPVPLHPLRMAERGYNQSLLLASPIARALRRPLLPTALVRLRHTPQQARLDRTTRLVSLYDAFACCPSEAAARTRLRDANVLLVDDVATTGATIDGCARALIEAGARTVRALVFARA